MTKAEIIENTLDEIGRARLEPGEAGIVVAELGRRLPDDMDIKTCEDFRHLAVECDECHSVYPHYDMSLIDLPDGGNGWVCDAVKRAFYPEKYQELQERSKNSPEGELLKEIFGEFDK